MIPISKSSIFNGQGTNSNPFEYRRCALTAIEEDPRGGGSMGKKTRKLTTPQQVEEAFVRLFDEIDDGVNEYIGSAEDRFLREQAMRNAVGMLEILRTMYQSDLQNRLSEGSVGAIH
jgi:hypothetical protein